MKLLKAPLETVRRIEEIPLRYDDYVPQAFSDSRQTIKSWIQEIEPVILIKENISNFPSLLAIVNGKGNIVIEIFEHFNSKVLRLVDQIFSESSQDKSLDIFDRFYLVLIIDEIGMNEINILASHAQNTLNIFNDIKAVCSIFIGYITIEDNFRVITEIKKSI